MDIPTFVFIPTMCIPEEPECCCHDHSDHPEPLDASNHCPHQPKDEKPLDFSNHTDGSNSSRWEGTKSGHSVRPRQPKRSECASCKNPPRLPPRKASMDATSVPKSPCRKCC